MEAWRDGLDPQTDNPFRPPNGTEVIENDKLLNFDGDIEQQLEEFLIILNNRRSDLSLNENDLNLDEIDDVVNQQLLNEELLQNEANIPDNIGNASMPDINSDTTDKDMDIISISSTDSQNSGYNSSDFEFITEAEAKRDSLIINFKRKMNCVEDPGEGTSGLNKVPRFNLGHSKILNEYIDRSTNKLKYKKPSIVNYLDSFYRNIHEIPDGDNFLNLFQGNYNPLLQDIYFAEKKSIKTSVMDVEYGGIGFNMQFIRQPVIPDSSDNEFEVEAKETVEKIISLYPRENNIRRRNY